MQPPLILYICGSRGDFLQSILFGNVLEHCWQNHRIGIPSNTGNDMKIHHFGPIMARPLSVNGPDDLLKYQTVRISVPTPEQQKQVAQLWCIKQQADFSTDSLARAVCEWEEIYQHYDSYCYKIVEFKDLFDIHFLSNLYLEVRGYPLTKKESKRIQHNIRLNTDLINDYGI